MTFSYDLVAMAREFKNSKNINYSHDYSEIALTEKGGAFAFQMIPDEPYCANESLYNKTCDEDPLRVALMQECLKNHPATKNIYERCAISRKIAAPLDIKREDFAKAVENILSKSGMSLEEVLAELQIHKKFDLENRIRPIEPAEEISQFDAIKIQKPTKIIFEV